MGGKQIEVRRKKPPYTNIQNKLIWDENLKPQTKWVLIAMLSLPDGWDYSVRGLAAKTKLSKETISKTLAELERAGYLRRKPQRHGEGGRFAGVEYILTDVAGDFSEASDGDEHSPCPSLPCTVEPCTVNSPQQNKDKQIKELINPYSPLEGDKGTNSEKSDQKPKKKRRRKEWKAAPDHEPEMFAKFWKAYPRKDGKQEAITAWDRLKPDKDMMLAMGRGLIAAKQSRKWTKDDGEYIEYASTWINNRRWENQGVDLSQLPTPPSDGGWAEDRGRYA